MTPLHESGTDDLEQRDAAWEFCRTCVRSEPVIVIGSGASAAYGLPTMEQLGPAVIHETEKLYSIASLGAVWERFKQLMPKCGLERAIDESDVWRDTKLYDAIRSVAWSNIAKHDYLVLRRVLQNPSTLSLSQLIRHLLKSHSQDVCVITTNYDRLVEYAAAAEGYCLRSGFQPGYLGQWRSDLPPLPYFSGSRPLSEKTATLWKVHGSLDWFALPSGRYVQVPILMERPDDVRPLIVPPSLQKHADTQDDPYRTILRGADMALVV